MLIVDKIGFKIAWTLFRLQTKEVVCIDSPSKSHYFFQKLLNFFGISVSEDIFKLAELELEADSSLYLAGVELSSKLAVDLASQMIESTNLFEINDYFERNTVLLRLSKVYQADLLQLCLRVIVASHRYSDMDEIFLEKPYAISTEYDYGSLIPKNINLYSSLGVIFRFYNSSLRKFIAKTIKKGYFALSSLSLRNESFKMSNSQDTVLSLKEDSISMDLRLRSQQFWLEANTKAEAFVLDLSLKKDFYQVGTKTGNSTVIPYSYLGVALKRYGNDDRLLEVRKLRRQVAKSTTLGSSLARQYAVGTLESLLEKSIEIGSVALLLNVKKFVFKETHSVYSDAIQLVAARIGLETICLQYSNLALKTCQMQTTADKFLMFSEQYRKIFSDQTFSPRRLIITGYPYREAIKHIKSRAELTKKKLKEKGATTVLGYFDENVHDEKFGLIDRQAHLSEMIKLAKAVLQHNNLAIVVKTQFMRNSIENSYPDDEQINAALDTGRFLGISEGDHRNNIYPAEVAISSDICVGHFFGATASLESALAGTRSVLINEFNAKPFYDQLLNDKLVFNKVDDVISFLEKHQFDPQRFGKIGDWTQILEIFDPFNDIYSYHRIREAIFD